MQDTALSRNTLRQHLSTPCQNHSEKGPSKYKRLQGDHAAEQRSSSTNRRCYTSMGTTNIIQISLPEPLKQYAF